MRVLQRHLAVGAFLGLRWATPFRRWVVPSALAVALVGLILLLI